MKHLQELRKPNHVQVPSEAWSHALSAYYAITAEDYGSAHAALLSMMHELKKQDIIDAAERMKYKQQESQ